MKKSPGHHLHSGFGLSAAALLVIGLSLAYWRLHSVNADPVQAAAFLLHRTDFINADPLIGPLQIGADEAQSVPMQPPPPFIEINRVSKYEGDSGQTAFDFTVTLSITTTLTVTVDYVSSSRAGTVGSATEDSDYKRVGGQLRFMPGQKSQTITVLVNGDTTIEPDETFSVVLRNPVNAVISQSSSGVGLILNDDLAASLIVQNTNNSGPGSLREAIDGAPADGTVTFSPTVFNVARTITLDDRLLINKNLTINGPGAHLLTVRRADDAADFCIFLALKSELNIALSGMTISNGRGLEPGGIWSECNLILTNVHVIGNQTGNRGGGVYLGAADGTFTNCTFSGNTAALGGGGIFFVGGNNHTLRLTNSTVSGNRTTTGGFSGGGVAFVNHYGQTSSNLTIVNSTIVNNTGGRGGGIFVWATDALATAMAKATIRNSIIANNTTGNLAVGSAERSTITSQGFNLSDNFSNVVTLASTDITASPLLGALQNNGGQTLTHALLPGSPALDKGHSSSSDTDQRGNRRPFDDPALTNATGGDGADIGAFEQGQQLFPVSAADYTTPLAQESIAAVFGDNLSNGVGITGTIPLPTTLNEASLIVRDSLGMERPAPLFFASRGQVNFQIPPGTALGLATIIARRNGVPTAGTTMTINAVEPGLFTVNATGNGLPAGLALRVKADGSLSYELLATYSTVTQRFEPVPINLAPTGDRVFLILYGTGIRFNGSLNNVKVNVAGITLDALFANVADGFIGLDQINSAELPRSLIGRKEVELSMTVAGKTTNKVTVVIQ